MKIFILPFVMLLFLMQSCNQTKNISGLLDAKQFAAVSDSLTDEQLIDVRTPEEYAEGHIANAVNMDWNGDNFSTESAKLDKTKPVMVYCLSGGRSADAADYLRKNGFTKVYELNHGILGWKAEHLPVTTGEKTTSAQENTSTVSIATYNTLITSQTIVLVDFSATWCGPCKRLAPRLDELVREMGDQFKLVKLDSDRDSELANAMNITSLPTLLLYKGGKLVWRNEGLVEKEVIADQIKLAGK